MIHCENCKREGTCDDGFLLVKVTSWNCSANHWICPVCNTTHGEDKK